MTQEELDKIIDRLRRQGSDDAFVEVKSCAQRLSQDIWSSVSAFANTQGGILILGLSEWEGFAPVPGFNLKKVTQQLITGLGDGDPGGTVMDPCPRYQVSDNLNVDGVPVLVVEINELEADSKPCYMQRRGVASGSYKRVGDQDVHLSAREIYSFQNILRESPADREVVPGATDENLDAELVDGLFRNSANRRMFRGADTNRERLVRANVIGRDGGVTLAGLLTCGEYPQQFFPKLYVDVAVHVGAEKADPTSRHRFLDRVICEGATGEVIETAYRAIVRNLRSSAIVEGAGRRDELEIPTEVIREAIANAVVHREYDRLFLGQSVQVDIYSDRVEVTNPGGLWGGKTMENLDDGISECRNAVLMKLMSCVPTIGTEEVSTEGNGSGIILMRRAMERHNLRAPEFEAGIDYFKVTLWRAGPDVLVDDSAQVSGGSGAPSRAYWTRADWHGKVLALLDGGGELTAREIADRLGRRRAITETHLRDMLNEGLIVTNGKSKGRARAYRMREASGAV